MMSRKRKPSRQVGGGWTTIVEGRGGRHRPSPSGHPQNNGGRNSLYMGYQQNRRPPMGLGRPLARGVFQPQRRGFGQRFPGKHGMGANPMTRAPPPPFGYNRPYSLLPRGHGPGTPAALRRAPVSQTNSIHGGSDHPLNRGNEGAFGGRRIPKILQGNNAPGGPPTKVFNPPSQHPMGKRLAHNHDAPLNNTMPSTPRWNRPRGQMRRPIVTLPALPPRRCRLPLLGGRFQEDKKPATNSGSAQAHGSPPSRSQVSPQDLRCPPPPPRGERGRRPNPPPTPPNVVNVRRPFRPNMSSSPANPSDRMNISTISHKTATRQRTALSRTSVNSQLPSSKRRNGKERKSKVNPPPPKPHTRSLSTTPKSSDTRSAPSEKAATSRQATKDPKQFRPSFGNVTNSDEDDDFKDIFSCPTSPLIHMSESSVPLIQKALKSAAQRPAMDTTPREYEKEGSYSPEIDWTGDVRMEKSSKKKSRDSNGDTWNSLPSSGPAPLRPSFKAVSQSNQSNSGAGAGQRKAVRRPAVRRPKRKAEEPEKVEFLFPPNSPIPALRPASSRPADKARANQAPPKLNQVKNPPRGARPLVLLGSLQDGPTKREVGSKKRSSDSANKSKSTESSYVHLSEKQQGKPKANLREEGEVSAPNLDSVFNSDWLNTNSTVPSKSMRKETKRKKRVRNQGKNQRHTIKRLQLKRNINLLPEIASRSPSPPKNIITAGGLESALKAIGEAGTILQPSQNDRPSSSSTSGIEKSNKRKRRENGSSGDPSAAQRSGKRQKALDKGDSNFKVNPVAMGLFGSLREGTTAEKGENGSVNMNGTGRSNQATQHKNIECVNLVEDPENPAPAVENPPRSNNGVIFLIDGATAGSCINTFRKKKMMAECFVTKKMKLKKSSNLNFHIHPSVGHQLTYFCARHVARWKRAPPKGGRKQHKVYVITKDSRFCMLSKSLKVDDVDVTFLDDLSGLKALLESIAK